MTSSARASTAGPEAQDLAAFAGIVGSDGVLSDAPSMRAYADAARYGGGAPACVVRPRTRDEVSRLVAHCVRRGLGFLPQSANTGLVLGSTPDDSGRQVVVSLERLTHDLEIDAVDRTVRASAGLRLSALNAALEPHGLFLPIDLAADPMLGGMAATNTGGARFLRYGDMRRHLLGLEVVLPDAEGRVLALSRGLRKDNSHLSLRDIFVGSCGAFGIITSVILQTHRRPTETAAAILIPRDDAAVLTLLTTLEGSVGDSLSAFEGMSHAAMSRALAHHPQLRNPFPGGAPPAYAVLVELARTTQPRLGAPSLAADLEAALEDLLDQPGAPLDDALLGPADKLWALRHALPEGLRRSGPVIGFDLAFRRSAVFGFRRAAAARIAADFPDYEVCDFGHVADGGLHFNLVRRTAEADNAERIAALKWAVLDLAVDGFGGSFSGEHGLGRANQAAYDRYTAEPIKAYSQAVAACFTAQPAAALRLGPQAAEPGHASDA